MADRPAAKKSQTVYSIRVEGSLTPEWSDWFEGLSITREGDHVTLISGALEDQSALFGLLKKIRDLGLTLISINRTIKKGEKNEK